MSTPPWRPQGQTRDSGWGQRARRSNAGLSRDFLAARLGRPATASSARIINPADLIPASSGPPYVRPLNGRTGPSDDYLDGVKQPSTMYEDIVKGEIPKLVVLDLNGTLCVRPERNAMGARNVFFRPYASSFLEYVLGAERVDQRLQKRFVAMIWSSAQPRSIGILLESIGLACAVELGEGAGSAVKGYEHLSIPLLETVWDRHSFGLTEEEFQERTATIKDLEKVWAKLSFSGVQANDGHRVEEGDITLRPAWSQQNTILIDDAIHTSIAQPNNLLRVKEFLFSADELKAYSALPLKTRASKNVVYDAPQSSHEDTVLLQMVGILETLRAHSNVSAVLKDGKYMYPDENPSEQEWEEKGRDVLKKYGIALSKEFDPEWAKRVESQT